MTYREDCGRVKVDGIDSRSILPEEQHASEEQSVLHVGSGGQCLKGLPQTDTDGRLLRLGGMVNSGHLLGDVDFRGIQLADPAKVLHSLAAAVLQEEPSRRLSDP